MSFTASSLVKRSSFVLVAGLIAAASATAGPGAAGHHASPIGEAGVAKNVTRTIEVDAADNMRFTPALMNVKKGETIRFVITNSGQLNHEFSLGTKRELDEHYEVMKRFPGMEHAEASKMSLKPGQTGEIIWRFTKGGVVDFACLHPGHYDAGMKGQIKVAKQ